MKKKSITLLKKKLWAITRQIVIKLYGTDCYTCGAKSLVGSNLHVGHFVPSSICGAGLRYDYEYNLRPCCYRCNIHLSGNWIAFKEHLEKDLGEVMVQKIINRRHEITKADTFWYEQKIEAYEQVFQGL